MDNKKTVRPVVALAASNAKGNNPLAGAVREALEDNQASQRDAKAA